MSYQFKFLRKLPVSSLKSNEKDLVVTEFIESDEARLVQVCMQDSVVKGTLALPYPYTREDAENWISLATQWIKNGHKPREFAVRDLSKPLKDSLVGSCSLKDLNSDSTAEIGYYVAEEYQNLGIGSAMAKFLIDYGFNDLGLTELTACLFAWNTASRRALEKAGFKFIELKPGHYFKNGVVTDGRLLRICKSDIS